jgi:hypothetical protein
MDSNKKIEVDNEEHFCLWALIAIMTQQGEKQKKRIRRE